MIAVETVNGYAESRMFVALPLDHVVLGLASYAVLRAEKRSQVNAVLLIE
jgi:hypothetical protein